ncbi:MAG TPA: HNH endonuclease signature motif containing protein [Candidatus Nitrosotalea sp.]|nr:HNH endonuclease [Nitrososphaerota archaeon]HKU33431.1 HNH endonuclease signature motif containing protein [Candidatus Nitrosotalea sp.]
MIEITEDTIWDVWSKGEIFAGNDPVLWRKDVCGAWIFRSHYKRIDSEYGWVIDYIKPLSEGGSNNILNLRPMHWENTRRRSDGSIECHITSTGIYNGKPIEHKIIEPSSLNIFY